MTKGSGADHPRRKSPWGIKRLLLHMILLAMLGAMLLAAGLHGRALLKARSDSFLQEQRLEALHLKGMERVSAAMLSGADSAEARAAVSLASSSTKRSLKQRISAMLKEGASDDAVIDQVMDSMLAALKDNPEAEAIRAAAGAKRQDVKQAMQAELSAALDNLSISHIRKALPHTDPNYALMFYDRALMVAGGVLLGLALLLTVLWFRNDTQGRVRVAEVLEPIDYLLPFLAGVLVFTLYPVVRVVVMSFQERFKLDGSFQGFGIGNYRHVLLGVPGTTNYFLEGLKNTLLFVLYTVPLSTALAVVIAYLLNQKLRFSALFQTSYFLPMVTSVTAVGLVWRWIFHKDFGLLNAILSLFGVDRIAWLQQPAMSMTVLVIFAVWSSLPFTIILLLSGLQNIDDSYYTVARVDGARAMRIFRRITLPLLAPTIGLVLTINSISAFKVFTDVTVLFNGYPGPTKNMYTVVYYIFDTMRGESLEYGRAAAAAIVLFLLIFVFTMLQHLIQRKWSYQ